jgi:hypothetical protein
MKLGEVEEVPLGGAVELAVLKDKDRAVDGGANSFAAADGDVGFPAMPIEGARRCLQGVLHILLGHVDYFPVGFESVFLENFHRRIMREMHAVVLQKLHGVLVD